MVSIFGKRAFHRHAFAKLTTYGFVARKSHRRTPSNTLHGTEAFEDPASLSLPQPLALLTLADMFAASESEAEGDFIPATQASPPTPATPASNGRGGEGGEIGPRTSLRSRSPHRSLKSAHEAFHHSVPILPSIQHWQQPLLQCTQAIREERAQRGMVRKFVLESLCSGVGGELVSLLVSHLKNKSTSLTGSRYSASQHRMYTMNLQGRTFPPPENQSAHQPFES